MAEDKRLPIAEFLPPGCPPHARISTFIMVVVTWLNYIHLTNKRAAYNIVYAYHPGVVVQVTPHLALLFL
jgi:hypothetical protein